VAISRRWPEPERQYREWYRDGAPQPFALGEVQFVPVTDGITVANLIGQHGMGVRRGVPPVRYDAIRLGLRRVAEHVRTSGASVHMPRIGCGLAGGRWEEIEPIIEQELCARDVSVTVYDFPAAGT
jgi:O-acetyl-ADP-ribose deacetylase (regulator of RNase III)